MDDVEIRRMDESHSTAVRALVAEAMGWKDEDELAGFFRWKHSENPFGTSPAWVAISRDGRLAGLRVLLRWEFLRNGQVIRAVRAVDTATHPDFRGRGIFTRLTVHALEDLAREPVAFVFNTPNDQSRPGYLKMGWQVVGRLPIAVRVRAPTALARMVGARVTAERESEATEVGLPASEALAGDDLERLLDRIERPPGLWTHRTPAFLRWRYGLPLLSYRVLPATASLADGLVVFRVRRRGPARELVVADALAPPGGERAVRRLVGVALRGTGADYALRLAAPDASLARFGSRFGPVLTWRRVTEHRMPEPPQWRLALGDIELF
jgi:GNAT superfamily N-acetyltransferase